MFSPFDASGNSRQQTTGYFPQQQQQQQQSQPYSQGGPGNPGYNMQQNVANSFNASQFPNLNQQGIEGNTNTAIPNGMNTGMPTGMNSGIPGNMSTVMNTGMSAAAMNSGSNPTQSNLNNMSNIQQAGNFYPSSQSPGLFSGQPNNSNNVTGANRSSFSSAGYQPQTQQIQPQATGYFNVPFQQPQLQQPQQTGMQQQQQTGLQQQPQQQTHSQPHPPTPGFGQLQAPQQALLPQQTGFYIQSSQNQIEPLRPNATGFVNSFANNGINNDIRIPVRRLPFITANDQAKFERLFRSMVPKGSNTISGNDCRKILMKSGLQPSQLARIWSLCDSSKAGELLFPEFALAMHLVNTVLQGDSIPYELDTKTKNEVASFIDAINLSIAASSAPDYSERRTPFDDLLATGITNLQPQSTGFMPQTSFGMPLTTQATGPGMFNPQPTGYMPQTSFGIQSQITGGGMSTFPNTGPNLQPQNTGFMPQTSFNAPLNAQVTGMGIMRPQTTGGFVQTSQPQAPLQSQTTGGFVGGLQNAGPGTFSSLQPQNTGGVGPMNQSQFANNYSSLQPQTTAAGTFSNLQPQNTGGFGSSQPQSTTFNSVLKPQSTGNGLQQNAAGLLSTVPGVQTSFNAPLQSQITGGLAASSGAQQFPNQPVQQQATGGFTQNLGSQSTANPIFQQPQATGTVSLLQSQQTGFLPPSGFNPTLPLTAQKTGFGNNEIYSEANLGNNFTTQNEDSITPEEKSLFYKIFETYDTQKKGLLDAPSAVEIFRKSGLNRGDLEKIWTLCDINNNGQLNKQEFALGMHLVYRKLNGFELPNRLPLNLIPSSRKILDNVKNQLKNLRVEDKKAITKTDALSYKNNDDEDVLPSFRNRRKVFNTSAAKSNTESQSGNQALKKDGAINRKRGQELTNAIIDKRNRLEAERARAKPATSDDFDRIRTLKTKLKNFTKIPELQNNAIPSDIRSKFDSVMLKLPDVFSQITDVDNAISIAKIELFKLKNPSSLVGTGPNGEITENDRKKAKSKALLKSRMDLLTGKSPTPEDSFESKEARYNEEIAKIKSEGSKNQEIISDIRKSIAEISTSLIYSLNGGRLNVKQQEFEKWKFGAGLEPDVRLFINDLNTAADARSDAGSSTAGSEATVNTNFEQQGTFDNQGSLGGRPHSNSDVATTVPQNAPDSAVSAPSELRGHYSNEENDVEEDDVEERKLKEELKRLKLKKKEEKEKRLAELRRQIEVAQAASSDEEEELSRTTGEKDVAQRTEMSDDLAAHKPALPKMDSKAPLTSAGTGGANPFFKQSATATSSFDLRAAENQRRLQRGLDHDDDWSDDEEKGDTVQHSLSDRQLTDVTKSSPDESAPSALSSEGPAAPLAPPLPSLNNNNGSPSGQPVPIAEPLPQMNTSGSVPPVPVAQPLPQVTKPSLVPPVPVAPPLPQLEKSDQIPPVPIAPPLPQVEPQQNAMPTLMAPPPLPSTQIENDLQQPEGNDSDDVLSIPDSVASDDHAHASSGIPPPPPLPTM